MFCIGHRGASGIEPENTLRAIRVALSLGVDAIEIDVHAVEDDLLVIHDHRLERTTNGHGRLCDHSFRHLRSLDAGKGERIPTLDEVLELVGRRAEIIVELKGPKTAERAIEALRRHVKHGADKGQYILSSFDHHALVEAQTLDRAFRRAPLFVGTPLDNAASVGELEPFSIHVSQESLRPTFVEVVKRRGWKVFVFTVNHPDDLTDMRNLAVDGVFTDYPDRIRRELEVQKGY